MQKVFFKITFFFLLLSFGTSTFATHIMGGEITWECLNNGQYIFNLKVYRDCNGVAYGTNNLALEAHNYPNAGNITLIPVSFFSVTDITPSCEGSPCATLSAGDPHIEGAIEEYILKSAPTTLNGVPPATGWAFTWTSGNRNAAIDNILNADNFGITLRAIMFPYFGQDANLCFDSSPDFYQKPSTIICAGEKFTYNHSAFDNDLDSLAYDWAKPLEGNFCTALPCRIGGTFVQGTNPLEIGFDGANGYSFDFPYPGISQNALNVPAVLDPETGEITFTSFTNGEYVSVIKVTAYKCGQKVAEIFRELQTVIASGCASNDPPEISALPNNLFRDTVKVGDTVRFQINILDSIRADNPNVDSIFVFGSGQQFGTNFTNPNAGCLNPPCAILSTPLQDTGIGRYTTNFYWETTCDHIQNTTPICFATANSYQFIIRAFDDFCPAAGQTIATYTITILADSLVENPLINCANISANGDVTIDWGGINDPDETFSAYMIYVSNSRNGPYTLLDSISDSTITSYTHLGAGANNSSRHYIVKVKSGCQFGWTILPSDTISTFFISPILNDTCVSFSWNGFNNPLRADSDTNYLIYKEYPIGSGFMLYDSTNLLSYCDTFNVCTDTVTYRIELGNNGGICSGSSSNTQGIRFKYPDPIADFSFTTPCSDLTIPFTNTTTVIPDSIVLYNWNFGDGGTSLLEDPSHSYNLPGSYTVQLIVTNTRGCIDSISKVITPDVPFVEAGANQTICLRDSIAIGGSPTSSTLGVSYSWSPTTGISNPSLPNPRVSPNDTTVYTVVVSNSNGCTNSDTVIVFVEPLPAIDAGIDQIICVGDTVTLGGSPTSTTSGATYNWLPTIGLSSNSDPNPSAFPLSSQSYLLNVLAPNGCSDTTTVRVLVNNLPLVDAGTDKNICVGQSVRVGGAPTGPSNSAYSWTPVAQISNANSANPDVFPLVNTTYFVAVTDSNGCVSIDSVAIILQPTPVADAGVNLTVCKEDFPTQLNGLVSISNMGRWIGGNGVFNPSRNVLNPTYNPTIAEINSGSIDLQLISDGIGICTPDTDLVQIVIPPFIGIINFIPFNVSCNGLSDGKIAVNAVGTNAPFSYRWSTNSGIQNGDTARGLLAGTYTVTVTNALGCDSVRNVIITEPATLTSSITSSIDVSCNGGSDGTATVSPFGGTTPYTYVWPSGTATATETGLAQGTYIVTLTDANSCTSTSSINITEPPVLTSSIASSTDVSCNGGNDGTATAGGLGGTTPYTYTWPSGATAANETGLAQGTYIVTITDANSCTSTSSVNISEPAILASSIASSTAVSCNGGTDGTAIASATGGTTPYSYTWPSGSTTANETGLGQGVYIVTVTDANSCTSTSSISITEPILLASSIANSTDVSCNGGNDGTAIVSASGGTTPYSYAWPSGTTTVNETGLAQGTYIVTITDAKNCTSTSSISITEPSLLAVTITSSTNVSCNAGNDGTATATATGGTIPYSYAWPSGSITAIETGLIQGTYVVTLTDSKNCTSTSSISISEPSILTSSIASSTNVSCNGGNDGTATATATGGTGNYTYLWPSNNTTATESNLAVGIYIVTLTDANGCSDTSLVVITEPAPLIASINTSTDVSCNGGSDGLATASAIGGTGTYTYLWPSNNINATEGNLAIGSYIVTVTDANACTDTALVVINEPNALGIQFNLVDISCFGLANGSINSTASGGTAPLTFLWSNGANTPGLTNLQAGNYTLTVSDFNGCQIDSVVVINEPTSIVLSVSANDTVCVNTPANLSVSAIGGTGNYTFNWSNGIGFGAIKTVNPSTTTSYSVVASDSQGCFSNTDSVRIYVRDLASDSMEVISNGDICIGETTSVSGVHNGRLGPYTYTWSGLGNGLGPKTVSPTNSQFYYLTITDVCGNSILDSTFVNVSTYPLINLPNLIATGCAPLEIQVMDSLNPDPNNYSYLWSFGDGNSSSSRNDVHLYDNPGNYTLSLRVINNEGCESNSTSGGSVIVNPSPTSSFDASPAVTTTENPEISFLNFSSGANFYEWRFDQLGMSNAFDTSFFFSDTGTYNISLLVRNSFGCEDSILKQVRINPSFEFKIPTGFTPNTNGGNGGAYNPFGLSNDVFFVFAEFVKDFEMIVFNRWGEVVFRSNDVNVGWDGYYRGKLCQQDVYVYKIFITWADGSRTIEAGDVTLFR